MGGISLMDLERCNVKLSCIGKSIKEVSLVDNVISIVFSDNSKLSAIDTAQYCCETRYITSDDNYSEFIGGVFLSYTVKDGPDIEEEYDKHNTQFLELETSLGPITFVTHNIHNGYYGGFDVEFTESN